MNVAEWILVAILSLTLLVFLIVGIIFFTRMLDLSKDVQKFIAKSQDIADNANDVVSNVKGMTAFGKTVETVVDNFVTPRVKEKLQAFDEKKAKAEKAIKDLKTEKAAKTEKTEKTEKK